MNTAYVTSNSQESKNILITSAGSKIPMLNIASEAAARWGHPVKVIAADSSSCVPAKFFADEFWLMPAVVDKNVDDIILGCHDRNIRFVFPSRDGELEFWAKHRKFFENEGIMVSVSGQEALKRTLDKLEFYKFCTMHGFNVIPTTLDPNMLSTDSYAVKERYGAGSALIKLDISLEEAINYGSLLKQPIFQNFVKGMEISADAWLTKSHEVKAVVLRQRNLVKHGEAQITQTFRNNKIEIIIGELLKVLKVRGHVVVQAMLDHAGNMQIIECNPRFGGASSASVRMGLDSLYWTLLEMEGVDVTQVRFSRKNTEIVQVRYPQDRYFNVDQLDD